MKNQHFKYLGRAAIAGGAALTIFMYDDSVSHLLTDPSLDEAATWVTLASYLGAAIFGIIGLDKWIAHRKQPTKTPLRESIGLLVVAVLLAGFPEYFFGMKGVAAVVTAVCYVIAFIFGSIGLWQLNARSKKPVKTPLWAPITCLAIAVLFGGFPELMGTSTNCGFYGCGPHDHWAPNSQIMDPSPIIGEAPGVQTHVIQD